VTKKISQTIVEESGPGVHDVTVVTSRM
jgi:hypothetical protein